MWFGDLVTMTWWEDTWLQESFADYMGYRVAADGAGFPGALLGARGRPQARRVRRRPAPLDPPGRPRGRGRAGRRRGRHHLRRDLLRQGQLGAAPAGDLAGRRDVPARREHLPDAAPLRERHPRRLRHRPRRGLRPRRPGLGAALAAHHRVRHDPGRARRRGSAGAATATGSGRTASGSRRTTTRRARSAASWWISRTSRLRSRSTRAGPSCPTATARRSPGSCSTTPRQPRSRRTVPDRRRPGPGRAVDDALRPGADARPGPAGARRTSSPRNLPGERSATMVSAVLNRTLARVLPLRVAADGGRPRRWQHWPPRAPPASSTPPARTWRWPSPPATPATSGEPEPLGGLAGGRQRRRAAALPCPALEGRRPAGLPGRRWTRRRSAPRASGTRGATPGSASRPRSPPARPRRPRRRRGPSCPRPASTTGCSPRRCSGLWQAEQADLVAAYVDRYLAEAPTWAARGQAFAHVVGRAFRGPGAHRRADRPVARRTRRRPPDRAAAAVGGPVRRPHDRGRLTPPVRRGRRTSR